MATKPMINLSAVKTSFFDKLSRYENFAAGSDIDPLELAQKRVEIITAAKEAIEDKSSPEALRWYGLSLVTGEHGFPIHLDEGIRLLNEAVMMRASGALDHLGDIYLGNIGRLPEDQLDCEKAIKYFVKSDSGYAQYRLARVYSENPDHRNIGKALDYAQKSAEHSGNDMGKCMWAIWLYYGDWITRDREKAYKLFLEIYEDGRDENGDYKNWAPICACFFIGLMKYRGEIIEQEERRGFQMIEEAAALGDNYANDWLNHYYS